MSACCAAKSIIEAFGQPLEQILLGLERKIAVDTGHEATDRWITVPRPGSLILELKAGMARPRPPPNVLFLGGMTPPPACATVLIPRAPRRRAPLEDTVDLVGRQQHPLRNPHVRADPMAT